MLTHIHKSHPRCVTHFKNIIEHKMKVDEYLDKRMFQGNTNLTILITGDHGGEGNIYEKLQNIINTYYLGGGGDCISQVNQIIHGF